MNFLRNLDLYKGIILVCLLLLPVAGFWAWSLQTGIEDCQRAIGAAVRNGGVLEEIGQLQKKMETVRNSRILAVAARDPVTYFDGQIIKSGSNALGSDDFTIPAPKEVSGKIGRQQEFTDQEIDVQFGKKGSGRNERAFGRDLIWAILYNCESGAGAGTSIWKLRKLTMVNAKEEKQLTAYRTPPPELEDLWLIKDLKFARRMPSTRK